MIRKELINKLLPNDEPVYAHMDDTILRKTGKKVSGTAWRRDPLGPPFHTNFIWGQRFIQLSIALPQQDMPCASRAIPVDFHHAPTVKKPKKTGKQWALYKEQQKLMKLSQQGINRITLLREKMNQDGASNRQLIVSVDGSYTNETVLKKLPDKVTLIGRVRKDCALHELPKCSEGVGRNRVYGPNIPTPEQIRQSDKYSWQEVEAFATGKIHRFNVKIIKDIRWRKSGNRNLQLVVIRPLGYRLAKNSRVLYRKPAYLICTDPNLNIHKLLQAYLWRWEIEVNFRDQKTILGCGKAQVRTQCSVEKLPAFSVVTYALMHLAYHLSTQKNIACGLPSSKWYPENKKKRKSTGDILNDLKAQVWAKSMGFNFSHFVNIQNSMQSAKNILNPTISAALYTRK